MRYVVLLIVSIVATRSAWADPSDDPGEWLASRGATTLKEQAMNWCCCSEIPVGPASERALRCSEEEDVSDGESYTIAVHDVVRVVRGGKAVTVFDAWTRLENLDRPMGAPPMFAMQLTIAADGRTATVVEDSDFACPRKRTSTKNDPYAPWINKLCGSRGTYRWRGGGFVRGAERPVRR